MSSITKDVRDELPKGVSSGRGVAETWNIFSGLSTGYASDIIKQERQVNALPQRWVICSMWPQLIHRDRKSRRKYVAVFGELWYIFFKLRATPNLLQYYVSFSTFPYIANIIFPYSCCYRLLNSVIPQLQTALSLSTTVHTYSRPSPLTADLWWTPRRGRAPGACSLIPLPWLLTYGELPEEGELLSHVA